MTIKIRAALIASLKDGSTKPHNVKPSIKDDKELVLAAMHHDSSNGFAVAGKALRDDKDLALKAVKGCPKSFYHVSDRLKNDFDVTLETVARDGLMLRYASSEMRQSRVIQDAARMSNPDAALYAQVEDDYKVYSMNTKCSDLAGIVNLSKSDRQASDLENYINMRSPTFQVRFFMPENGDKAAATVEIAADFKDIEDFFKDSNIKEVESLLIHLSERCNNPTKSYRDFSVSNPRLFIVKNYSHFFINNIHDLYSEVMIQAKGQHGALLGDVMAYIVHKAFKDSIS